MRISSLACALGKSSKEWLARQSRDQYAQKRLEDHYRARSAYKLIELNKTYKLFFVGANVLDCGAAPGSWLQVAFENVQKKAKAAKGVEGEKVGNLEKIAKDPKENQVNAKAKRKGIVIGVDLLSNFLPLL